MRKGKLRQVSHVFTHGDLEKVRGYIKPEGTIREDNRISGKIRGRIPRLWYEIGIYRKMLQ